MSFDLIFSTALRVICPISVRSRMPAIFALLTAWALCSGTVIGEETKRGKTDSIYIQAGLLLADPANGSVLSEQTVVVREGRIVEILAGYHSGENGVHIDLKSYFVLPGLIDSHVHLLSESTPHTRLHAVTKSTSDYLVDGIGFANATLEAGFTTVADLGSDPEAIFALRDGIASGKLRGPDILAAGIVVAHGGHGDAHGYRAEILNVLAHPGLCSGADDCRRAVRQSIQRGADLIKIASTGGVMSNTGSGVEQQMSDAELEAIVDAAHSMGRRVVCHAHGTTGVNAALRAGVDSIEHGTYLDDTSIEIMTKTGTYLVPTLLAGDTVVRQAESTDFLPPAIRAKAMSVGPDLQAAFRRAWDGGVPVAFGTDSGVSKHGENAREFSLMVEAGMAPIDVIRSATVWGAHHNDLSDRGSLKSGYRADIIAVASSPLDEISVLESVEFVMKEGQIFVAASR